MIRRAALTFRVHTCLLCLSAVAAAQNTERSWLDRALAPWNVPSDSLAQVMPTAQTIAEAAKRCDLGVRRTTSGERTLAEAGWLPYLHVDRQIVERDIEIVGGMTAADAMCRPDSFNVFVFVGGRFAGTLSPAAMRSRADGEIGAVRLLPGDIISAEFARYRDGDAVCCPTGRVTVRYRIDREPSGAVVVPVSVQSRR